MVALRAELERFKELHRQRERELRVKIQQAERLRQAIYQARVNGHVHIPGYVPGVPYIPISDAMTMLNRLITDINRYRQNLYLLRVNINALENEIAALETLPYPQEMKEVLVERLRRSIRNIEQYFRVW